MTGAQWFQPPRDDLTGGTDPGPAGSATEPEVPDPGAGDWTDEAVVSAVLDAGRPAPSTLYLLDPEETGLVYDRWVLSDTGMARLRDSHRRGVCTPERALVSQARLSSRPVRVALGSVPVVGVICLFVALIYLALAVHGGSTPPEWPNVAMWCAGVGLGAVIATAAVQRRANRATLGAPLSQVTALLTELERRRVRPHGDAAVQLATSTREAWRTLTNSERWADLPAPERSVLSARLDRLLWDLARSETLVDQGARTRALRVVAEDCAVFIEGLATVASGGSATPPSSRA